MRKKLMKATAVAVLAVLANIEALATGESGGQTLKCYKTVSSGGGGMMTHVTYCGTCSAVLANAYSDSWQCN